MTTIGDRPRLRFLAFSHRFRMSVCENRTLENSDLLQMLTSGAGIRRHIRPAFALHLRRGWSLPFLAKHTVSHPRRTTGWRLEKYMFEQLSLGTKAKKRTDELNEIVVAARHERQALASMFERLDGRNGRLAEVSATVEHVRDRAVDASDQLTAIVTRMRDLDEHVAGFEALKAQIAEMTDVVRLAKEAAALMSDSGGQLQKHREAMEQLEDEYREARRRDRSVGCSASAGDRCARRAAAVSRRHAQCHRRGVQHQTRARSASEPGVGGSQRSGAISKTAEHTLDSTAAATRTVKGSSRRSHRSGR